MSRSAWRIATDARDYEADDLSGAGAKITGGRWNAIGIPMLYASGSRSLACLETVVHLNAGGLPLNRYLVEIEVPDDVWAAAEVPAVASFRIGWDAEPAGRVSIAFGSDWVRSRRSLLLCVPSVIVPEETDILVNPEHPDLGRIRARKVRRWLYDPRLGRLAPPAGRP
ncbi:type II toxin-antitoxin system Prs ADP-ribosylating toxin ParT [uncultured Methylobacterium sp.]|uniref:type II toxin-antitoxin system Prs ADP-ribosylating toxin ParT n=1 Tax=uncultured Methylobacterium sp. TaxID=157278 RepID=UPI0035CA1FF3